MTSLNRDPSEVSAWMAVSHHAQISILGFSRIQDTEYHPSDNACKMVLRSRISPVVFCKTSMAFGLCLCLGSSWVQSRIQQFVTSARPEAVYADRSSHDWDGERHSLCLALNHVSRIVVIKGSSQLGLTSKTNGPAERFSVRAPWQRFRFLIWTLVVALSLPPSS